MAEARKRRRREEGSIHADHLIGRSQLSMHVGASDRIQPVVAPVAHGVEDQRIAAEHGLAHFLREEVVGLQASARDPVGVVLAAAEGAREIVARRRDAVIDAQARQIGREEGALLRDAGLLPRIALLGVVVAVRVVVPVLARQQDENARLLEGRERHVELHRSRDDGEAVLGERARHAADRRRERSGVARVHRARRRPAECSLDGLLQADRDAVGELRHHLLRGRIRHGDRDGQARDRPEPDVVHTRAERHRGALRHLLRSRGQRARDPRHGRGDRESLLRQGEGCRANRRHEHRYIGAAHRSIGGPSEGERRRLRPR